LKTDVDETLPSSLYSQNDRQFHRSTNATNPGHPYSQKTPSQPPNEHLHMQKTYSILLIAGLIPVFFANTLSAETNLLELAKAHFTNGPPLSLAEQRLFSAAESGEPAMCTTEFDHSDLTSLSEVCPNDRIIRADRLGWLFTDPVASKCVSFRGISIVSGRVDGDLNLEWAKSDVALRTSNCVFVGGINLKNCHLRGLHLIGTHIKDLQAEGLQIDADLLLINGFKATGIVRLNGANIGGDFQCSGGQFINHGTNALIADGITVGGDLLLDEGCKADGGLRFPGAVIAGDVKCDGGQFTNPKGVALNFEGAKIDGYTFMKNGFIAEGEVRLFYTTIGFALECDGGHFKHTTNALDATGAKIKSYVSLGKDFQSEGSVVLLGAKIEGALDCTGGQFRQTNGPALDAEGTKIDGYTLLKQVQSEGEIRLINASIGLNLECGPGHFAGSGSNALNATLIKVAGNVILDEDFSASGGVLFRGSTISGNLTCNGARFSSTNGPALDLESTKICGDLQMGKAPHENRTFEAQGEVSILASTISLSVICDGGHFNNPDGLALNADRANIGGSVFMSDDFQMNGLATFTRARVGGDFQWTFGTSPSQATLDLTFATVKTLLDDTNSWPEPGKLLLYGFTYETIHQNSPYSGSERINWLNRQPAAHFSTQPYEQLAAVLRRLGHEHDAAKIMVAKNQNYASHLKWAALGDWPRIFWYYFIGWFAGYGYLPERAFWFSVILVSVGWLIFHIAFKKNRIVKAKDGESEKDIQSNFNPLVYSLETFVPLLELDMGKNWRTLGKGLRAYFYVHRIFGWVLTTLWVGALTGLLKT
jgi:hypothetical protein